MGSQVNERKKERKKRKEGKTKRKKHLDKFFFTKLTMQNIEEFCFVSIVKRGGIYCYPIFDPCFDKFSEKNQK